MISLKRYLDSNAEALLPVAVESYQAALAAMARSGTLVFPQAGVGFEQSLMALKDQVSATASASAFTETEQRVEAEIEQWTQAAAGYLAKTTVEVRGLVTAVAESVQSLAERDQRYAGQFTQISKRLQEVAVLDNLRQMRDSLSESIRNVNASVEKMVREGEQSVASLRAQVDAYQERLAETERLASRDALTGIDNRRGVERQIEALIAGGRRFSVILIDLNGFKPVNDQYGHLAGDSILKQFAHELKPLFRPADTVGRWGGDEFIVAAACDAAEADAFAGRIRQWVFGDYTVESGGAKAKVRVDGAIGLAHYRSGDTLDALVARADAAMYKDKAAQRGRA